MTNPLRRSLLNLWGGNKTTVLLAAPSGTNDADGNPQAAPVSADHPLPVTVIGGGGSDVSALSREATQLQVRDAVTSLNALLGNTDTLEALQGQTNSLLTTQASYLDQVESLLTTLGTNTDGIEGLLAALGVKDDNVLTRLAALDAIKLPTTAVAEQKVALDAGVSVVTLAVPTGAKSVTIQPQGTDVRIALVNTGTLDMNTGTILFEGERERFAALQNVRVVSAAAVSGSVQLIWWGS